MTNLGSYLSPSFAHSGEPQVGHSPAASNKATASETIDRLKELRAEAFQELSGNILPFSMHFVVDREHGGFYGHVANNRVAPKEAPKGLVQHSRMLWIFAHASRLVGDPDYPPVALRALDALSDWFWDVAHGGFFWMVDHLGQPLQTIKFAYGQAFALYGLVEYHLVCSDAQCLERAIEIYHLLERYGRDPEYGGYWEACHRDWSLAADRHLDETDLPVAKGMNTHLHILEAYTNLLRTWDDGGLKASLQALIHIILRHILNRETHHLSLFFDREWRSLSDIVSYGHDIECSWLLVEAAEVLGNPELLAQVQEAALQMAYATLEHGVDADGGLFDAGTPSGVTGHAKDWWPQAEALVGFLNAYQLNGDPRFLDASLASWHFVQEYLVDREYGEWFETIDELGCPLDRAKAGLWKTPYHNGRACLEIMGRVQELTGDARG
jgi:mannobiose 2-epimerase